MTECLVLHASTDPIQAAVPDAHDMEWVRDAGDVIKMWRHARPVRVGEISGDDLNVGEPVRIGAGTPSTQVSSRVPLDHVNHPTRVQIDHARHIGGRVFTVGFQHGGLIDAELTNHTDAVRVIDEWSAVLDHRVHDRPPTHPELASDTRHRSSVLTDLAARLNPGTARQYDLRVDMF